MTPQPGLYTFRAPVPVDAPAAKAAPAPRRAAAARRKVKVLRVKTGRYVFVICWKENPLYVSPRQFDRRGDAKAAGKHFERGLPADWALKRGGPEVYGGYCYHCLAAGQVVPAARQLNGNTAFMCRPCYDERHPGLVKQWGDVR